ncbi:MAG: hypothetical protein V1719_01555, partial [Patescibacteria group bacterium]
IDLAKLREALAKLSKSHSNSIIKPTAVATLGVAILLIGAGYYWLSPFFTGVSSAQVLNETFEEHVVLITNLNGQDDKLLDSANDGFVYSSYIKTNYSKQLRYQRIDAVDSGEFIPVDIYGSDASNKFASAKTDDIYVIWGDEGINPGNINSIYYRQILPNLGSKLIVPQNPNDRDISFDIYNGTIALIRQQGMSSNTRTIWTYTPGNSVATELITLPSEKQEICFDDNKIVWADKRSGDWDIWMIDLGSGDPQEQPVIIADDNQTQPNVSNNKIVWTDDGDINSTNTDDYNVWLKDIMADEIKQITNDTKNQQFPTIYNNVIVWQDSRNDDGSFGLAGNIDVYMYDLDSLGTSEKIVSGNIGSQLAPMVTNGYIFWTWLKIPESNPWPEQDIVYTTYDELNLIAPESDINFNFADIKFSWEFKKAGVMVTNAIYTLKATHLDTGEIKIANLGGNIGYTLPDQLVELLMKDGTWEWSIKAQETIPASPEYWSTTRTINKQVAATLIFPDPNDPNPENSYINEATLFDWETIDNVGRYIAKIEGYLPDNKPLYLPLPPNKSEFQMNSTLYELLKPTDPDELEKTYSWSVSGTKLTTQIDWQNIYYGPSGIFKVKK